MRSFARVWDGKTGSPLGELIPLPNNDGFNAPLASLSPDGMRVVTTAGVRDVATGKVVAEFNGPRVEGFSAAFSPDGTRIVTASKDAIARLWDAQTGALIATLEGHRGPVYSAVFSSDGSRVLTSDGRTARLWSVTRCQALIDAAMRDVTRELSAAERARFFLDDKPPGAAMGIYAVVRSWFAFALPRVGDTCI